MNIFTKLKKLSPHNLKIINNTYWLLLERAYRMFISFFVVAWTARYLGPSDFGLLAYAMALAGLLDPIYRMGLRDVAKKYLILEKEKQFEIKGAAFFIRMIASFICFFILIFASYFHKNQIQSYAIMLISISILFTPFDMIEDWFSIQLKSKITVFIRSIALTIASALRIYFIIFEFNVLYFALTYTIEAFIFSLGFILAYRNKVEQIFKWNFQFKDRAKNLLLESWPLILSGVAIAVYMKIDQFMLKHILGDRSVGVYAAAVKLSEIWYFIPATIITSFFPNIINNRKQDPHKYKRQMSQLMMLMTIMALGISLPFSLLSEWIIPLVLSDKYVQSIPIFKIHIWSCFFVFWGVAQASWDVAENLNYLSLFRTTVGGVLNILLNLYLIPKWGGEGAAIATLISYASASFLLNLVHPKTRVMFWIQVKSLCFWKILKLEKDK